jgi:hypothetical protein
MLETVDFLNLLNLVAFGLESFFGFGVGNVPLIWFNFISADQVFALAAILVTFA